MKFEREYTDGNGKKVRAVIEIADTGIALERALAHLVNKARQRGRGTALSGAVQVTVTEVQS